MSNSTHTQVLLAGAAAAFTVDLLIYPLDTLKTRIQSRDFIKTYAASTSSKAPPASAFRGLYQGVGIVIVATLPAAGVFFSVYESSKTLLRKTLPSSIPQPIVHSLASGLAELSSCVVLTPAEVIKQNAQMIKKGGSAASSSSLAAFRMLASSSEGGVARRMWTGYAALAARNLPFTALQFPMFEAARARAWRWRRGRKGGEVGSVDGKERGAVEKGQGLWETGVVNGVSAGASGAVAAVITTPTDVVKTRMMLMKGEAKESEARRAGGVEVARQVYREKGLRGLFRGGVLRAGWTAVGMGLYLGTYEVAKVWLKADEELEDGT